MLISLKRRFSAIAIVFVTAIAAAVMVSAQAAHAGGPSCTPTYDPISMQWKCPISDTSGGGGGGGQGTGVGINCDTATNTIQWQGQTYKCSIGNWSFSGGCYIQPVNPQPPAGDPVWGSSDPNTNRVQWEDCTNIPPTTVGAKQIVGPCVGACGGPNPVQTVTSQLVVNKPAIGMAPADGTVGFVNQNVWFWTTSSLATQTASAGTVIGVRTFDEADWDITLNGAPIKTLKCASDNEYTAAAGAAPSPDPDCNFQFTKPGVYAIAVRTHWTIVITQNGVAGNPIHITSAPAPAAITIKEGQSTNG